MSTIMRRSESVVFRICQKEVEKNMSAAILSDSVLPVVRKDWREVAKGKKQQICCATTPMELYL